MKASRAWIGLAEAGLTFREEQILLDRPETAAEIRARSPAGRVPVLFDGGLRVHDSLAILVYLDETHARGRLLPADVRLRARIRSVSAEMHAGFPRLRETLPMNLSRPSGPLEAPGWRSDGETRGEIERILSLWQELLAGFGGPFLFGPWSMADCMYLPVATRFRTYAVDTGAYPEVVGYLERLLTLPAFLRWEAAARLEPKELAAYQR
jgi:glutathione S-transferase